MSTVTLYVGDVHDRLTQLADGSVDLIVTSPPFLALRSYLPADHPHKPLEIGSEVTPAAYLDTLLALTAEWRRLLAPHGSLCVELGDTYSGSGGGGGDYLPGGWREGEPGFGGSAERQREGNAAQKNQCPTAWPLVKSLTGIPTLYTWSLAYGRNLLTGAPSPAGQWRIRNLLVWARPNPPVGALGDKFRPACSYITVACTGARRWFDLDAVRTELSHDAARTDDKKRTNGEKFRTMPGDGISGGMERGRAWFETNRSNPAGAPPLDWHDDLDDGPTGDRLWQMSTSPYKGAHYATYPLELPLRLIKAMCPERVCRICGRPSERIMTPVANMTVGWTDCGCGKFEVTTDGRQMRYTENHWRPGLVLDPFLGSGTTAVAAALTGRDCIGIDLDDRNTALVDQRLRERLHITRKSGTDSTITWRCDAPLPDQTDQIEGQTNLFDHIPHMVDVDTRDRL